MEKPRFNMKKLYRQQLIIKGLLKEVKSVLGTLQEEVQPRFNKKKLYKQQGRIIKGLLKEVKSVLGTLQEEIQSSVEEALQRDDPIKAAEEQERLFLFLYACRDLLNASKKMDYDGIVKRASCIRHALAHLQDFRERIEAQNR